MVSTYSPNRGYELPGTGDYVDTWGPVVNGNFSTIDSNISSTQTVSLSSSNVTLNASQAKNLTFLLTGTLLGDVSLIYPAVGGFFIVRNTTTGAFRVTVITAAGGSTGVAVQQGQSAILYSNGTNVYSAENSSRPPVGSGMDYWGTTAPPLWVFPYGQAVSRTTYSDLFAVFGTTYGSGDGSTTFNLPDKRGRGSYGRDDMGGASANRITNQPGGWNGSTLGAAGGSQTHSLVGNENGPHLHTMNFSNNFNDLYTLIQTTGILVSTGFTAVNSVTNNQVLTTPNTMNISGSTASAGLGNPHNNLPPGITCNYIIFAGA